MIKIIRWTPIVTASIIVAMYLGMKGYNGIGIGYGNPGWVAQSYTMFGTSDIKAMIGHDGAEHFLINAATFVCYFVALELLLKQKWKAVLMVLFITGLYLVIEELLLQFHGVGASGWIMSIPGYLLLVAAWRANKLEEHVSQKFAAMLFPVALFGLNLMMAYEDVKALGTNDLIGHEAHLLGAGISIAVALIAIAIYLPKWTKEAVDQYQLEKEWKGY